MIKKQFTLYLDNKPGSLAAITKKLATAKVNIEGISVSETTDVGLVQIIVNKAAATKKVLNTAKVPFSVQDVSVLSLKNKPGALCELITLLAKQKVNISYVYATSCECLKDCSCRVVISAPNLKKVEKACSSLM
ncbi:MAG: ACT domain-containing protein [Kiritimatiellae bacterium]|nr:ACT domain-containing protein [Kiritimatiellia bacterium]